MWLFRRIRATKVDSKAIHVSRSCARSCHGASRHVLSSQCCMLSSQRRRPKPWWPAVQAHPALASARNTLRTVSRHQAPRQEEIVQPHLSGSRAPSLAKWPAHLHQAVAMALSHEGAPASFQRFSAQRAVRLAHSWYVSAPRGHQPLSRRVMRGCTVRTHRSSSAVQWRVPQHQTRLGNTLM